jgi:DNA-binding transcriptional MerR regulator
LLPPAWRTHTDYRIFPVEAAQVVRFIKRCKAVDLNLGEMKRLLTLARNGQNPLPGLYDVGEQEVCRSGTADSSVAGNAPTVPIRPQLESTEVLGISTSFLPVWH